jgi:hypothetical protein
MKKANLAAIVFLMFFFPVGLYIMWAKTNWHKNIKWGITAVFGFFTLIALIGGLSGSKQDSATAHSPSPTTVAQATNRPEPTVTPTEEIMSTPEPLTLEDKIKGALPDSISNPDVSVDDAIDFNTDADVPGKKDVTITANHNGTYWDTNSTKEATWKEAVVIMQRVFPLDEAIHGIIIMNMVPVTDAYGKSTTDMLTTIDLSRDTYDKIDFKNFDYKNIPVIADKYIENHNIK